MKPLTIRLATKADTSTVVNIWNAASAWLRDQGEDQWQYPVKMHNVNRAITERACWIVDRADGVPVGTITLDENADPDLWLPSDHPDNALYLHRLVVDLTERGQNVGASILDWAGTHACAFGKPLIRLDAWSSNTRLHQYYRDRGFRHVRTVEGPDVVSGVCFERPSDYAEGSGPPIVEVSPDSA